MQKNDQIIFKSHLGNNEKRSKEQRNALYNIEMLYKARNEAIKLFDNYSSIISEAKNKATKGTGLKILTPKQIHSFIHSFSIYSHKKAINIYMLTCSETVPQRCSHEQAL